MNGEIHRGRDAQAGETAASCNELPRDAWGNVIRSLIEFDCPLAKARVRRYRIWDERGEEIPADCICIKDVFKWPKPSWQSGVGDIRFGLTAGMARGLAKRLPLQSLKKQRSWRKDVGFFPPILGQRFQRLNLTTPWEPRCEDEELKLNNASTRRELIFETIRNALSIANVCSESRRGFNESGVAEILWERVHDAVIWHEILLKHRHIAPVVLHRDLEQSLKEFVDSVEKKPWNSGHALTALVVVGIPDAYVPGEKDGTRAHARFPSHVPASEKLSVLFDETCRGDGCNVKTGWDDVYAPWATRLCEACYTKKYVKKEEYHTKYFSTIPRIILDRFETQPVDHKGGVPRSDIDRLEYMYTHERFSGGLIDEKCRMMLDELGLPRDVCERSETFNKIMRSHKRSMSRKIFVRDHKKRIRRELDDL